MGGGIGPGGFALGLVGLVVTEQYARLGVRSCCKLDNGDAGYGLRLVLVLSAGARERRRSL